MISAMLSRSRRGYLRSFFMECGASGEVLEELLTDSDSFTMPELISGLAVMFNHTAMPEPHIPSVVIHGTEDRIIPFEAPDTFHRRYSGTQGWWRWRAGAISFRYTPLKS